MMRVVLKISFLILVLFTSCNNKTENREDSPLQSKNELFPKGDLANSANFSGNAWVTMLITEKEKFDLTMGNVLFEPGARTNWHVHPGGQVLICTKGIGYFQEKGGNIQVLQVGDVVEILPDVEHWHGASPDSEFEHIAISTQQNKGGVIWKQPVSDEEYKGKK